jgi:hypothetical protein
MLSLAHRSDLRGAYGGITKRLQGADAMIKALPSRRKIDSVRCYQVCLKTVKP